MIKISIKYVLIKFQHESEANNKETTFRSFNGKKPNERSGLFHEEVCLDKSTTLQMYTAGRLHCRLSFHM